VLLQRPIINHEAEKHLLLKVEKDGSEVEVEERACGVAFTMQLFYLVVEGRELKQTKVFPGQDCTNTTQPPISMSGNNQ